MKIWLITSGEPIPINDQRPHRTGILSKMFAETGNQITWWSTTFDHQMKQYLYEDDAEVEINENLKIIFLHSRTKYHKNISLKRIKNHREVSVKFEKKAKKKSVPDLIFCSFPTIDLAYASVLYAKEKKVPVIIDVRDLWPDIFVNPFPDIFKPVIKLGLFKYFRKTKYIFKNACAITAVSNEYLQFGLNYACRKKTKMDKVFPIGFQTEPNLSKEINHNDFSYLKINPKKINIWFVGTFGRTYDLSTVISVAKMLDKTNPNINFIFTGDGEKMKKWRNESSGLDNIIFTGWVEKKELKYISEISNIGLMAYVKGAPQGLPNKIYEYMSSSLPILSSLQSETKELIEKEKIGLTYTPNNPEDLLAKLKLLVENKDLLNEMSLNSFTIFDKKFDSKKIYKNLINYLINFKKT